MQTRRAFIKTLLGFGGIILPWSFLPIRFGETVKTGQGQPSFESFQPPNAQLKKKINEESLCHTALDDIRTLSSPEMQGRKAGAAGEAKAAGYLVSQLNSLGLQPMGKKNTEFTQRFTIPPVVETKVNGRLTFRLGKNYNLRTSSVNLIGGLTGIKKNEIILLSAHYDHLGIFDGKIYPGANDNASGVGCILDVLRRILRERNVPKRTIAVAFWSAEEMGFVGSQAFVRSSTLPLQQIKAVLNADTVGNGKTGEFALWGDGLNIAVKAIQQATAICGASASLTDTGGHNSDSVSFASAGIPAVTLMTSSWLYKNHTPEDTFSLLNPDQIHLASEIIYEAVRLLAF